MTKRIVTALVALPFLFLILYFAPEWVLTATLAIISSIAAYELLHTTGLVKNTPLLIIALVAAAVTVLWTYLYGGKTFVFASVIAAVAAEFIVALMSHGKVLFRELTGAFFAAVCVPLLFASILRIRAAENGIYLIILPFLSAWMTDTCAYFAGSRFGRHKLSPRISPNKTIEGSIGGILGCVMGMLIYAKVANAIWGVNMDLGALALLGMLGSVAGQFGDLSFSYIKRNFGIKDFGKIMPGHGGILDRFDSVLFAAPVIELLLVVLTVIK